MIFEAIAVVQTANTAIGAVKDLLNNGKDLSDCASQLGKYFDAKAKIQKKAGSSQSTGSDLEMFLHLEKLKQAETELKEILIYQGRGGLYQDFLKYQALQKQKRDEAAEQESKERIQRQKRTASIVKSVVLVVTILLGIFAVGGLIYWLSTLRRV